MRDPNRIDQILNLIRTEWIKYPDLRLGQLLVTTIRPSRPCPQVFYVEDDVLETGLNKTTEPQRYAANESTIELTSNDAIVLLELLSRFDRTSLNLTIKHPAETTSLQHLQSALQQKIDNSDSKEWPFILDNAQHDILKGET